MMQIKKLLPRLGAGFLAASILTVSATPAMAAGRYNDYNTIVNGINLAVPQKLAICKPSGNITSAVGSYYITGTSNPNQPLYMDGTAVEGRGRNGSFGAYVTLSPGANTFTFTQGNQSSSVTITYNTQGGYSTTNSVTKMTPQYDSGYEGGSTLSLSCVAPSGSRVTATLGGVTVQLGQVAAAMDGVPARFKGEITIPGVSAVTNLGPITYTLTWQGSTKNIPSAGNIYGVPKGGTMLVQVIDTSSNLYPDGETETSFLTTAKKGAIDAVIDQNDLRYKLAMGGWINKDTVKPLTGGTNQNTVSGVGFSSTVWGERYKFSGTTNPMTTTSRSGNKLSITLHHTSGIASVPTGQSKLFGSASVTQQGDDTVIEFTLAQGKSLWGYTIEYADGVTTLYCKYPATLSGNANLPLSNIIVALDAGHGGVDSGALGPTGQSGPMEKDITAATALALKRRLQSLGATVIYSAPGEGKTNLTARMQPAHDQKADLYLSLHCNSVAGNGLKPSGTEIYYYEDIAKPFAQVLQKNLVAATGRNNRGSKFSNYRVTLNTLAPAVLVEMGFVSNPVEYDELCSNDVIYTTVNAIADGILEFLA
ncbi:MAG: N-acetylmuramoyl-L-alanine amidase [Angelakisella sp.]|nr:N-acetylmuramoyl-L-alanine amidase [Angelakisella sp.]